MKIRMSVVAVGLLLASIAMAAGIKSNATQEQGNPPAIAVEKIPFQAANAFFASHYTTAHIPQRGLWMMQPLDGARWNVDAKTCGAKTQIAEGAWYVTQTQTQGLQLLASSHVKLLPSQSERLDLVSCEQIETNNSQAVRVPDAVLTWLRERGGVVQIINR